MKTPALSFLMCAMMALTQAASLPEASAEEDADAGATPPLLTTPPKIRSYAGGWFPSCPEGWTMYSTRCLLYVAPNMTWADAQANCGEGHLASATDAEQAKEIQEVMQRAGHKQGPVWVGGRRTAEHWGWTDYMSPNQFHHWCNGEPTEHHCLQLVVEGDGTGCLDDSPCDERLPSMCGMYMF